MSLYLVPVSNDLQFRGYKTSAQNRKLSFEKEICRTQWLDYSVLPRHCFPFKSAQLSPSLEYNSRDLSIPPMLKLL